MKTYLQILAIIALFFLAACQNKKIVKIDSFVIADINEAKIDTEYLKHYYLGVDIALKEINQKGGVRGIPLKLVKKDNKDSPIIAYSVAKDAMSEDNAFVLMGGLDNTSAQAIARFAKNNKIVYLNTGTVEEDILKKRYASDWTFKLRSGLDSNIKAIAKAVLMKDDIKGLEIVTYSGKFGDYADKVFREAILEKKPKMIFMPNILISQDNMITDDMLDKIQNSPSKAIVFLIHPRDIRRFTKQLQTNNRVFSKDVFMIFAGETEWLDSLGNKTPSNWIVTGFPWYDIDNKVNTDFISAYNANNNSIPRNATYIGYSAVYLIYNALSKSQIYENNEHDRDVFRKNLETAEIETPFGELSMRKDHQSSWNPYVGILKPYNIDTVTMSGKKTRQLDVRIFNHWIFDVNKELADQDLYEKQREESIKEDTPPEVHYQLKDKNAAKNGYDKIEELFDDNE